MNFETDLIWLAIALCLIAVYAVYMHFSTVQKRDNHSYQLDKKDKEIELASVQPPNYLLHIQYLLIDESSVQLLCSGKEKPVQFSNIPVHLQDRIKQLNRLVESKHEGYREIDLL